MTDPADSFSLSRRRFLVGASTLGVLAACSSDMTTDSEPAIEPSTEPSSRVSPLLVAAADVEAGSGDAGAAAAGIPTPTGAIITRWHSDPFSFGSYSYLAVGADESDRDLLRADVDARLFFAGEATSSDYFGTVHGAFLEGSDAAERIASAADPGDEIVVIGAGTAGLAAARRLSDLGFAVVVLEGRDRTGGRVHSDGSLGVTIELGAGWVHGDDGNPLLELVEAVGASTVPTKRDDSVFYDSSGERIDDTIAAVEALITDTLDDLDDDDQRTLAAIFDDAVDGLDASTTELTRYLVTSIFEHEFSGSIDDLTWRSFDEGDEFDGDDLQVVGGYSSLHAPLLDGIAIELEQVVESISHDDTGVEIGLAGGRLVRADRVLVTVPLGVLKAGSIAFSPTLDADKTGAIERLGMGVLDRVVLRFDEQFWDDADLIGFVGNEPGRFIEWYDLTEAAGAPTIVGFNAADVAIDLEEQSDRDVIAAAMRALVTMYGT